MMQVIEMTHSEKVEMYQMIEKDRLIEMLIEANNVINQLTEVKNLLTDTLLAICCPRINWCSTRTKNCKQLQRIGL